MGFSKVGSVEGAERVEGVTIGGKGEGLTVGAEWGEGVQ